MTDTVELRISMVPAHELQGGLGCGIWTSNGELFKAIVELGYPENYTGDTVKLRDPEGSPRLAKAFQIIREHLGMERTFRKIVKAEDRHRLFSVFVERTFTQKEVDSAKFLQLWPRHAIATNLKQLPDETFVVEADQRLRVNKIEFGSLYNTGMGCDESTRMRLEELGLNGLAFRPILVEPPDKYPKKLWYPWSTIVMPPCAYGVVRGDGEPFAGDYSTGCYYDTQVGGVPTWTEDQIREMPPFDVAITKERTATTDDLAERRMIVTQLTRRKLDGIGLKKNIQYTPIVLLQ